MKRGTIFGLVYGLLSAALAPAPAVADDSYLLPPRIYAGDMAELVIEYDSKIPSLYAIDTSSLQRDFRLIGQDSRVVRMHEDGEVFHRMQWRMRLQPRRSGRLELPSLEIGDRRSRALVLEVLPLEHEMLARQQVFVEIEVQPANPYVGQQTLLISRLYHNTPLAGGRLAEPKFGAALTFDDNRQQRSSQLRNGSEFEVSESRMALIPAQAGPLRVEPASYRGQILTRENSLRQRRSIYRESDALQLEVRAPPAAFSGDYWLPARRLTLQRDWPAFDAPLEAGAAFDFTLTMEAVGINAEALPESLLALDDPDVKIYPDRSRRSNVFRDSTLVGRLEQRYVVIPERGGRIEIPGLDLAWWNVDTDREQRVRLEAVSIDVLAAAAAPAPGSSGSSAVPLLQLERGELLAILLLLAAMLTAWGGIRLDLPQRGRRLIERERAKRAAWRDLERACRDGDAAGARRLLLAWARKGWGDGGVWGLDQIERRIGDPRLAIELRRLDAALYAPRQESWQGRDLWRILRGHRRPGRGDPGPALLPRLYPG